MRALFNMVVFDFRVLQGVIGRLVHGTGGRSRSCAGSFGGRGGRGGRGRTGASAGFGRGLAMGRVRGAFRTGSAPRGVPSLRVHNLASEGCLIWWAYFWALRHNS